VPPREARRMATLLDAAALPTLATLLTLVVFTALALYRRLSARPAVAREVHSRDDSQRPTESPPSARPPRPGSWTPFTGRRRLFERPEIAAHRRVAEGRARPSDVVPNVVYQYPEVDWRPRVALPFETSLFHSQIDALDCSAQSAWRALLFGRWHWWSWLASPTRVAVLVEALTANLRDAPEPEKSRCVMLLDEWLTKGVADHFHSLRATLSRYRQMSQAQVHRREADALEYRYGEEWLLSMLLRSVVATMVQEGVLRKKTPSQLCVSCLREFVESSGGEPMRLVCFLPCSHWMDAVCWEEWRAAKGGSEDHCPACNGETRATVEKEYCGHMRDIEHVGSWERWHQLVRHLLGMRRMLAGA